MTKTLSGSLLEIKRTILNRRQQFPALSNTFDAHFDAHFFVQVIRRAGEYYQGEATVGIEHKSFSTQSLTRSVSV
jgi:hypothetical protein